MQGGEKERWKVREINCVLEDKERRLGILPSDEKP